MAVNTSSQHKRVQDKESFVVFWVLFCRPAVNDDWTCRKGVGQEPSRVLEGSPQTSQG